MHTALVADDHQILRSGLKLFLTYSMDMEVTEAQNGEEALAQIAKRDFDIVLLDLSMPGRAGLDLLKSLRSAKSDMPILILSAQPEERYAVRALKAGASGYVDKSADTIELMTAIRKCLSGGRYVSPSLAEKLIEDAARESEDLAAHETLSDREFQILCQIGSGKSVGGIAKELHLSVKTISTYRKRILEKMKLATNSELMQYALKHRLLEKVTD